MNNETLRVIDCKLVERVDKVRLSKIQQLVCKLFKIIPEKWYSHTFEVKIQPERPIPTNAILIELATGNKWVVLKFEERTNTITLCSLKLSPQQIYFIQGELVLFAVCAPEMSIFKN